MTAAPLAIESLGSALRLSWADGQADRLEGAVLRQACRCAPCVQLARAGQRPSPPAGVVVTEASLVGHYGVQLQFSDGHGRGIYPWAYLRRLAAEAP